MKYLVFFVCLLVIPIVNIECIASAFPNNEINLIYFVFSFIVFGLAIKFLKEDKNPIIVVSGSMIIEDFLINLFFDIRFITYIIQFIFILAFFAYTNGMIIFNKYIEKKIKYLDQHPEYNKETSKGPLEKTTKSIQIFGVLLIILLLIILSVFRYSYLQRILG